MWSGVDCVREGRRWGLEDRIQREDAKRHRGGDYKWHREEPEVGRERLTG